VWVDAILPTEPLRAGESETLAAVRDRVLAQQEAKRPLAFREPDVRTGVALVLPAVYPREVFSWVDADGVAVPHATVSEGCADILWPAENASVRQSFRLRRADGAIAAEVNIEPHSRDFTLRTADGIRAWLRLAVHLAPDGATSAPDPGTAGPRFSWRPAAGTAMPVTWLAETGEPDALGVRVPLGSVAGAVSLQGCGLFDQATGWAIVTDIRQAADRPLGE
jgi:hypothetical protein